MNRLKERAAELAGTPLACHSMNQGVTSKAVHGERKLDGIVGLTAKQLKGLKRADNAARRHTGAILPRVMERVARRLGTGDYPLPGEMAFLRKNGLSVSLLKGGSQDSDPGFDCASMPRFPAEIEWIADQLFDSGDPGNSLDEIIDQKVFGNN